MSAAVPRVSVCMPASRDTDWFELAVRSALAQTTTELEIIVTDDSGGKLARVKTWDERIRYIANPTPLGFAGNHCRALDEARGAYIAILQDDDIWEPDFLAATTAALEEHPSVGIAFTGALDIDQHGESMGVRPAPIKPGIQPDPLALFLRRDFMLMLPSLTVFRGAALAANPRPWPDNGVADVTMYLDLARAGWGAFYVDRELARYRSHDGQVSVRLLAHRNSVVSVFERYLFAEPAHETARRRRLADALLARAGIHIREGDAQASRADLRRAARLSPAIVGPKSVALGLSTLAPSLAPAVHRLWTRLRDPVKHRHRG